MPRCWIALGGNIGDVRSTQEHALGSLTRPGVSLVKASRFYDTTPVGSPSEQRYLNAAAELDVSIAPEELLDLLQQIELDHGRERSVRWGPRTLDLDLLLYAGTVCDSPRLTLPHPALWYRRFVLDPLAEIAPGVIHPVFGETIERLRSRIVQRPVPIHLHGREKDVIALRDWTYMRFRHDLLYVPQDMSPAIVFELDGARDPIATELLPRTIDLRAARDPLIQCEQYLTAALDEPIAID